MVEWLSRLVGENLFRPQDVPGFENKLFFEGRERRRHLERFTVLLILATVIATYGVLGDSTATVIGAMIIAPLMTPIMATAAALVMGQMNRALQSLLIVVGGVATVIFLSWLIGTIYGGVISAAYNSQIAGRINPRMVDLFAALASGAAGAFAMSRDDVADSLPGVAISISLVPPLCVVGLLLSVGDMANAMGAMLLFITNFLSILLAGGGVLGLLGLNQAAMIEVAGTARRNAFLVVLVGVTLVAIPLGITSAKITREAILQQQVHKIVENWIVGTEFDLKSVEVNGVNVEVLLTGPNMPVPSAELAAQLSQGFDENVIVSLELVPSVREMLTVQPTAGMNQPPPWLAVADASK
ncbi:MAG: hypothetical protein Kow0031_39450 [Anaerolineae bacterium]